MALPTTGPISLANVNVELGRSSTATISLNETAVRNLAGISSGAISMADLRGKSAVTITLSNQSIIDIETAPDTAYAYYFLTSGGKVAQSYNAGGTSPTDLEQWCTPTTAAADYEAKATPIVGFFDGGSGTGWVALSSTREWYKETSAAGESDICEFTIEIRKIGTTTILDSATIYLEATVS
jgi:hypothetical protein